MHFDIAWQEVDTVLLDMDGTLLDLAFDNYFWQTLVPETWGAARGLNLQEAKEAMRQEYHAVQHTLNWYCLDYWSERLGLDICAMTSEQGPRATLREDTVPFLDALKACGKRRILLTNAHPHNLAVKLKHTGLDAHLDLLLSTHTFGYPKEDQRLWRAVAEETGLEAHKTLFVDDSEAILDAAREFGIRYCLDKWLWAARYYKTRALAREMIEGGKVHYNGQRSKPGKIVELDAMLTLRQGNDERTVRIIGITEQRRPASEAVNLYEETAESIEKREKMALARKMNALTMPHPDRRPDKKERRDLMRFKHGESE